MSPRTISAGTILLQRFKVLEAVSDRGLGETWRVESTTGASPGVAKLLPSPPDGERERTLAAIKSPGGPGIVTVRDAVIDGDQLVVVHDSVKGRSLHAWLEAWRAGTHPDSPMYPTPGCVQAIALALCGALQALHADGFVHGALSPRSVILDSASFAAPLTLLDAGVGSVVGPTDRVALRPYALASKDPKRADLMALVVMIVELLSLRDRPADGSVTWGEISPRRKQVESALTGLPGEMTPSARAVLLEFIAPSGRDRVLTPAALRADLLHAWQSDGILVEAAQRRIAEPPAPRPMAPRATQERTGVIRGFLAAERLAPQATSHTPPPSAPTAEAVETATSPRSGVATRGAPLPTASAPTAPVEELADDTLPIDAPPVHDAPKSIPAAKRPTTAPSSDPVAPSPRIQAAVRDAPSKAPPPPADVPSTVERSSSSPTVEVVSSDDDELVSTLPLSAAAVRSVLTEDAENTLPIGASASAFNADSHARVGEVIAPLRGAAVARSSPRTIRPSAGITPPEPTQRLGPDLFAESSISTDYDDAHVPTSVKVGRPANPGVILPAVAVPPSPMGAYGTDGQEGVSPTMAVPGLAPGSFPSAPAPLPSLREEADEPLSATTKFAIVLTGVLVSIAIFVILTR